MKTPRVDHLPNMRTFTFVRDEDVSGVSGVGLVMWGVVFPDGKVATRWNGVISQVAVWECIEDVEAIHGHEGKTRLVWDDPEDNRFDSLVSATIQNRRHTSGSQQ